MYSYFIGCLRSLRIKKRKRNSEIEKEKLDEKSRIKNNRTIEKGI